MKIDKDFKEALANLPSKEKDKLILRLLKRDVDLVNKLYFELMETMSVEEKRTEMELNISRLTSVYTQRYYSPGYLLMEIRDVSGSITEHVKTTKDKFGDIALNIQMLSETLMRNEPNLSKETYGKSYTFNIYVVARVYKILTQIKKLHEDLQYDLKESLAILAEHIGRQDSLMRVCINNALDMNWLFQFEIPSDIEFRVKELRRMGFLK